jgi:branched-chain amino acid transport system ATP-binding protein
MSLLALESVEVQYGGIRAVKGIDLTVDAGELVSLIGANGAGKTTTLRAITGLVHARAGRIVYDGENLVGLRSHEVARKGIALVPEGRGVFPQLTIDENLAMGAYTRRDAGGIAADTDRVFALFPRLKERRRQTAGTMSGGEQQMLAIGRALMSRPRLLLLDEPSMGLSPIMVERIFEVIRVIASEGVTMLLVEQNARLALEASRRAYVLESGLVTLSGEAAALLNDPQVRSAYLGE